LLLLRLPIHPGWIRPSASALRAGGYRHPPLLAARPKTNENHQSKNVSPPGARWSEPAIKRGYNARFKITPAYRAELPDMMAATDAATGAPVPIQQVGVSNFRLPLKFRTKRGAVVTLEASVTGTVSVAAGEKGINMSRIVRTFYEHRDEVFTLERLRRVLVKYRRKVPSRDARVQVAFSYPLGQRSLRSGLDGYQYYAVTFEGRIDARGRFRRFIEFDFVLFLRLSVQCGAGRACRGPSAAFMRSPTRNAQRPACGWRWPTEHGSRSRICRRIAWRRCRPRHRSWSGARTSRLSPS